ncbi:MAG: symmetrical bis(5'-nucleosyl)-tetraphosphatase [Pseudomonadota bacterium]
MATYAIGDVQGCYADLRRLLDRLDFDSARDALWFCGDLVNRGPQSLEVLRFVRGLGDAAITVLGNHDLHLLALAAGNQRKRNEHSLDAVLGAPDRDELLSWLRHRPLMHRDKALGFHLIHAGLPPQWTTKKALSCAREMETALRDEAGSREFFHAMYGNRPDLWRDSLKGMDRLRFITNCFTRLRYCDLAGRLALKEKGAPGTQGPGFLPWFKVPGRRSAGSRILFGHWSTLGLLAVDNVWALDTGCLWGGTLTALRIDGSEEEPAGLAQVNCAGALVPG